MMNALKGFSRYFWLTVTVVSSISPFGSAQVRPFLLHKFQADGTLQRKEIHSIHEVKRLRAGEKLAILRMGDSIKSATPPVTPLLSNVISTRAYSIPETYYARLDGTDEQVVLSPVLISESPMRYNKNSHLFQGLLLVILEESGQSQSKKLSQPVSFAVASDADEVVPKDASIDHSNFPPLEIRFASLNPSDSVQLTFITSTNPQGYRKYLPVEPILSVEAADTVLEGFGIERTNITVTMKPPGSGQVHALHISSSLGSLDPEEIHLVRGQASTHLRSEGIGNARVTLTSPDFSPAELNITCVFPWSFLSVAFVGGIVGGIVRKLVRKSGLISSIVVGVLWGLIVAVAWAGVGLNLLSLPLPSYVNEAVVFVLCALAALIGPTMKTKSALGLFS